MDNLSQRYLRLCQAYSQLAERYTKLDIDHMTLRERLVPFLMAFKYYKQMAEQLSAEKLAMQQEINDLRDRYQTLATVKRRAKAAATCSDAWAGVVSVELGSEPSLAKYCQRSTIAGMKA